MSAAKSSYWKYLIEAVNVWSGNASRSKRSQAASSTRRKRTFVPIHEQLENRSLLAAIVNGTLYIHGTAGDDVVNVAYVAGKINVVENGKAQSFDRASITTNKIWFMGNNGNDKYDASKTTGIQNVAYGGDGNDTLIGGDGHDVLCGDKGNDYLSGGYGNDSLYGAFFGSEAEDGADILAGGYGDDVLFGGDGNDSLRGLEGNDVLFGGKGHDQLYGGYVGNSSLDLGGDDVLWGGDGDDTLEGGKGNDQVSGENGHDHIQGGAGDDQLSGGDGNDRIYGQDGKDRIDGGWGNDLIFAGAGDDEVHGGDGHDTVLGENGVDKLFGDLGNDVVYGGNGNDIVSGGKGDDIVYGGDGADYVFGDEGDDEISGGYLQVDLVKGFLRGDVSDWNDDRLSGGEGRDTFYKGDKKFAYVWLDKVIDKSSVDRVHEFGWGSGGFEPPKGSFKRWGHLYGT